jgi:hypothetical protein
MSHRWGNASEARPARFAAQLNTMDDGARPSDQISRAFRIGTGVSRRSGSSGYHAVHPVRHMAKERSMRAGDKDRIIHRRQV